MPEPPPRTPTLNRARDSLLLPSRTVAVLGVAGTVGVIAADALDDGFWARHTMITALLASLLIIAVSVGVVNELVDRRDRRRWSALAQTVIFELVRSSRVTWIALIDVLGLFPADREDVTHREQLAAARAILGEAPRLQHALTSTLADPEQRRELSSVLARVTAVSREAVSAWAPVMISSAFYAELFDRHVELHGRLEWVSTLLWHYNRDEPDTHRRHLYRASIAVEVQTKPDDLWLRDFLHALIRLAEGLDREAATVAMRLVPPERWLAQTSALIDRRPAAVEPDL
jgi:hypothetical protein